MAKEKTGKIEKKNILDVRSDSNGTIGIRDFFGNISRMQGEDSYDGKHSKGKKQNMSNNDFKLAGAIGLGGGTKTTLKQMIFPSNRDKNEFIV